jgi:hypothetical protein
MQGRKPTTFIASILLLVSCLASANTLVASSILSKRISITAVNEPIQSVLSRIEKDAEVRFMYNSKQLQGVPPLNFKLTNATIKHILQVAINDKNIVFYELNKYIVIAKPREVPRGTKFEQAIEHEPLADVAKPPIADVVKPPTVADTIHIIDTVTVTVFDTIIVTDTQVVSIAAPSQPKTKQTNPEKSRTSNFWLQAELLPAYQFMLGNSKDKGLTSLVASGIVSYRRDNFSAGLGIGTFVQRGTAYNSRTETILDSTLHKASKTETHRYVTGQYYYTDQNGATKHVTVYDSVTVTVPYQWYSTSATHRSTEVRSVYSATWLTFPLRLAAYTSSRKAMNVGLALTLAPALCVAASGNVNNSDSSATAATGNIHSFTVFASALPYLALKAGKSASFYVGPSVQSSLVTPVVGSSYLSMTFGIAIGVEMRVGAKKE